MAWSFWIQPEQIGNVGILSAGPDENQERGQVWMYENGSLFLLGSRGGRHIVGTGGPVAVAGEWQFVTVVFSDEDNTPGAERVSLYVDGLLVRDAEDSRECCVTLTPGSWTFGIASPIAQDGLIRNSFQGSIDDFRVFSRSLSPAEVQALYEETR